MYIIPYKAVTTPTKTPIEYFDDKMRKWISCNTLFGRSKMSPGIVPGALSAATSSNSSGSMTQAGPLFKNRNEENQRTTQRLEDQQMMKLKHVSGLMANAYNTPAAAMYPNGLPAPPPPESHNMRVTNPAAQFNNQFGLLGNGIPGFPFPQTSNSLQSTWAAIQAQVESNKGLLAAAQAAAQQAAQQAAVQQHQQEKSQHHAGLMGQQSSTYPPSLPVTSFGPISGAAKTIGQDMFNTMDQSSMLKMNLEKNMMQSILLKSQFNSPTRRSPPEKAMIE